jgi:hypothetical protein
VGCRTSDHTPPQHSFLDLAHELHDAAATDDVDRVHSALCELQHALAVQVHADRASDAMLSRVGTMRDRRSQLLRRIDRLLFESTDIDDGCSCIGPSLGLAHQLARHASLEVECSRRVLGLAPDTFEEHS